LLLLFKVCDIVLPQVDEQLLAPLIPAVCTTAHVNAVPPVVLVRAIEGAAPLHIDGADGVAVIEGVGLTVITTVVVAVHPLAVPVIV
jgi:hypothetical protein